MLRLHGRPCIVHTYFLSLLLVLLVVVTMGPHSKATSKFSLLSPLALTTLQPFTTTWDTCSSSSPSSSTRMIHPSAQCNETSASSLNALDSRSAPCCLTDEAFCSKQLYGRKIYNVLQNRLHTDVALGWQTNSKDTHCTAHVYYRQSGAMSDSGQSR